MLGEPLRTVDEPGAGYRAGAVPPAAAPAAREHVNAPAPRVAALAVAPARMRLFVPSRGWGSGRRRRILFATAGVAVLFHVLLTICIMEAPRLWPRSPPVLGPMQQPPTIDMVMDESRFNGGSKPMRSPSPAPPAPEAPPTPPKPPAAPVPAPQTPQTSTPDAETVAPDAPTRGDVKAQAPAPQQQASAAQPEIDLDPSDALGYGRQEDPHVIPASPDDRHANKMPAYPRAAGRRGEEGAVQMLVSIGTDGSVASVEIAVSSGYADLDRTAVDAVARWHFRPAIQNGVPVPTRMMQVFNYHIVR